MPQILNALRARAWYAWVAFLVPPVAIFGHALAPGRAFLKGQDLGVLSALALAAVAFAAWVPFRASGRWPRLVVATMAVMLVAWLAQILVIQRDGDLFTIATVCLPLFVVLLAVKPPSAADIRIAGLVLAYGLAAIAVVSLVVGLLGWMPSGFEGADNGVCRTPVYCQIFGNVNRWAGPFGSVNYAAPVGAVLIVLGAAQVRRHAVPLVAAGVLIMFLSQGRSALFATIAGLVVVILSSRRVAASPQHRRIRAISLAGLAIVLVVYMTAVDPDLNGRVGYWKQFLGMWRDQPWTGIGTSGILDYNAAHTADITVSHAHSVILDQLVRWGPVMALLTVAILVLALLGSARALRTAGSGPLAVAVAIVVAGLVETLYDWTYWSVAVALLLWSVMSMRTPAAAQDEASRADAPA
ncbi:MAG: O-antigen ligase family protein [Candidatus Nanopelagicales bacterium]|nr:O-antigen ligase family protein [Candidatus Nanopelagicales bacterium]